MWNLWQWVVASNERALANARIAAIECSRRRLERVEVHDYLDRLAAPVMAVEEPLRSLSHR